MFETSGLKFRCFFVALILMICVVSVSAGDDKDHPLLSRMPGYVVSQKTTSNFDAVLLPEDKINGKIPGATYPLSYEGRVTRIEYKDVSERSSNLAIYRNYVAAIRSLGGRQLNTGFEESSQGVMYDNHVFEIPNMGGARTVVLLEMAYNRTWYYLTIIEPEAMAQDVKAGSLARDIESKGVATLYMNFDENKSDLKSDGVEVVKQIASLMAGDPTLKLSIEGHTDNVGSESSNKKLSADRAQAVMRAVVAKGIAGDRLNAKGLGAEVPVADNRNEEGRAKNRRVELVKVK